MNKNYWIASGLPKSSCPNNLCDKHLHSSIGFPLKGAPVNRRTAPVICFPFQRRLHKLSRKETPAERQHPFGPEQILNPYPPDYRAAFASFGILFPHTLGLALRLAFPRLQGDIRGFRVPHKYLSDRLGPTPTPVAQHLRQRS